LFRERETDAHKGTYGHTLTVCGSIDKPGAGILSSFAVLKSGAGLCTAAVSFENRTLPPAVHPELMTLVYRENSDLLKRLGEFNAVLVGPGMGATDNTAEIAAMLMEHSHVPLVMDADALNVLQSRDIKDLLKKERQYPVIVTPHPGEFSRLTGRSITEIKKDRIGAGRAFAGEYNVVVVLKGHHTIIATPGGRVYVNPTGNPGMATAGSGDVLGGMIAGMISQFASRPDYSLDKVLQAAVFIHGYAGDLAVEETGEISLTAVDITRCIPAAILHLDDYRNPFPVSR
jgi:NAD(P)H-hydrate epimerase